MSTHCQPSRQQLAAFTQRPAGRPVLLFYQFDQPTSGLDATRQLAQLASPHGGSLRWAASEEQVLIGPVAQFARAACLHFRSRSDARNFVETTAHAELAARLPRLQVSVVSVQPKAITWMSALLAWVLPKLPLDRRVDTGAEPYAGSSTMPTPIAYETFQSHPAQATPVVMINWLKFRAQAHYPAGEGSGTGQSAYQRYGKVALNATHSLGAKLLAVGRYQQLLIGHDGDPALGAWDEFALMQYPSRQTFALMASLHRYRKGLVHRQAALAEHGQALTISKPDAEFVWRG